MKDKPNQGFTKQLTKKLKAEPKKTFDYKKPVAKVDKINNMAVNSRSREYRSVSPDKTTSFSGEQRVAKASHKGK